jgi:hypothetical protein
MKGQTWIEFIIATAIFLLSISFIFITATGNLKEEIQKSNQQSACLKVYELENILRQPGVPSNWNSSTGFSVFGLSNGSNMPLVISDGKWLAMENFGFVNVSINSTPSKSWNIGYDAYAFEFKPDSFCVIGDGVKLCRANTFIIVDVSSTQESLVQLRFFFPFSSATASSTTTESNDLISTATANGTYVTLKLNTNSTDSDSVNMSVSSVPKLVFIDQFSVESSQALPFKMGGILLQDSFGAYPPPKAMICDTKVSGLLNLSAESLLVNFNLEAW